ncbi:MAG: ATP-binding cassette domain-containing protein [Acidobacteria bacterium]|nr:ATP-binding cassette domain-containing protein [Acidobacteriota bacterium]
MIRLDFAVTLRQGVFTLEVADAASVEVLGVFGPSGSGKTSLLEVIAGLRTPDTGHVRVADRLLLSTEQRVNVPPHHRQVGYVPQDVALFPHLDVRGNLLYGAPSRSRIPLHDSRLPSPDSRHDLEQICTMLEIAHLVDRRVADLSGGERQRVAIGRALMSAPRILLLDEPLTAVDRSRKDRILPYLLRIRRELHVPMVYVTHDWREMHAIADRVLVLEAGRVGEVRSEK